MQICIFSAFEDSLSRDTGASVRIYNLSNELISLGHDVQLVIPGYERKTMRISGLTVHVLNGIFPCRFLKAISELIKVLKPTALFFYDIFFIKRAYPLIRESEIIQVEQPTMSGLLVPIIAKVFKKPIVVDCHDVFQALRIANIGYIRKILETIVERVVYKFASVILTVSEKEKQFLLSLGIDKYKIKVIPNGVDTTVFARSVDYMGIRKRFGLTDKRVIVFVGNLEYPPNKEAVRLIALKIAPKVIDFVGNATFLIVGRKNNIVYPNLSFTGVVNDVISVLLVSDCAIAPLIHGSGTRLKILEYLSCGLPVVSTSVGAEGLNVVNGEHLFIEDDMDKFAMKIIELLQDEKLRKQLGNAGRELVIKEYNWSNIGKELNAVYFELKKPLCYSFVSS